MARMTQSQFNGLVEEGKHNDLLILCDQEIQERGKRIQLKICSREELSVKCFKSKTTRIKLPDLGFEE